MPQNKYGAKRTIVDGIAFASKSEAAHYRDLKILQLGGEISNLTLQPSFVFMLANGIPVKSKAGRVLKYIADFSYLDKQGKRHISDVKGFLTSECKLKIALTEALYGITVELVK